MVIYSFFAIEINLIVLYSHKDNLWKITDFGFTSQGTSNKAEVSSNLRGTEGYRAPELLEHKNFTNKVDVWAVGCIFYELITNKKAFDEDYSTHDYSQSSGSLSMVVPNIPDAFHLHLSQILDDLLHRESKNRPTMTVLCSVFQSYYWILDQTIASSMEDLEFIPEYSSWKSCVCSYTTQEQVLGCLAQHYQKGASSSRYIQLAMRLVSRYPSNLDFQRYLKEAIEVWKDIVNRHPDENSLGDKSENALKNKGQLNIIPTLMEMIDKHPNEPTLREELDSVLRSGGKKDDTIEIWKGLVDKHPDITCLQIRLQWACEAKGNLDKTIEVWGELARKHPDIPSLHKRLWCAIRAKGHKREAKKLRDKYPGTGDLNFDVSVTYCSQHLLILKCCKAQNRSTASI